MHSYLLKSIEFVDLNQVATTLALDDNEIVDTSILVKPVLGFTLATSKPVPKERQEILRLMPLE